MGTVKRGSFTLNLDLEVAAGETVALLGPNGAGKSTALHTLAGLLPLATGSIRLGTETLDDGTRRRSPDQRRVGVVFQDYLLFPHLSLLENVAFGLRARGSTKTAARRRAADWLRRVGLGSRAQARPSEVSGGQAQRVALARALASEPDLLLLDEPLAAVDAGTRLRLRSDLRAQLRSFAGPAVLITHDLADAMVLADRIIVLENGETVQSGSPRQVTTEPRSPYMASLVGVNIFTGLARKGRLSIGHSKVTARTDLDGRTLITLPPTAAQVRRDAPEIPAHNIYPARVVGLEEHYEAVRLRVSPIDPDQGLELFADVPITELIDGVAELGARVWVEVDQTQLHAYPF
ncbi:ABC transporter ATP-binding protein [Saxibacter everestensis]|uniref:ABC transporter ATP-binding protein n=1 Tax=Saxibacter everestensis TaxID=2909229 RepID=A0ABY8QUL3_9MICO|nr:ABC transporter ATP-binding protein [Brevibacteriaceae bacterium ZFBP1038]